MILESSADSSKAVRETIRARIYCFSTVSIHVEKKKQQRFQYLESRESLAVLGQGIIF